MQEPNNGNGNALPKERQEMVESSIAQYVTQYHAVAAERDDLQKQVTSLRSDIAGYRVAVEAMQMQINDMQSRMTTMEVARDQAVGDRAVYEALFISVLAQLKAFKVPSAPLIREVPDVEVAAAADNRGPVDIG